MTRKARLVVAMALVAAVCVERTPAGTAQVYRPVAEMARQFVGRIASTLRSGAPVSAFQAIQPPLTIGVPSLHVLLDTAETAAVQFALAPQQFPLPPPLA